MTVRITTLNNGLRVVSDDMAQLKTATVGVWVGGGARDETVDGHGVAHMLEHMAFKGTERRSARAIAEEIEAVGGHLNAYTSREQTAYYARIMAADSALGLDILADILQHSAFEAAELERERTVVIQEIGQVNDTPDDVVFDYLQEVAYPGQLLGRSILGTESSVGGLTQAHLRGFMAARYRAPQMVLVGAGAIDHDRLVALAADGFAGLPSAPAAGLSPARYGGGEFRDARDLDQVHVALAFPGVAYDDPDFYAVQVYATLLGGGMSSRLFQEVREKRGLCYSIFAFAGAFLDGGLVSVYAGTGENEVAELVPLVAEQILATTESVRADEIARAQAQLKVGLVMSLESSSARAEQLGRQMLIYGRPLDIDEVMGRIDAVDAAAVRRAARRMLTAGRPSLAAIGPLARLESYDRVAARFGL